MRNCILYFILLINSLVFAQSRIVVGVVSDSIGNPLENSSVMAIPQTKDASLKFAIADNKGRYRLELESTISYKLEVSYIGFKDASIIIVPNDNITEHFFKLLSSTEKLQDVVIKYEVKPIIVKEDTLTYNVKSFTNGNERKLKDQLQKLPGVDVDKNGNVTLQGKRVSTTLVENKSFFGGGSKLAVENIPADAIDKVEFIDHFNDIGFMKKVSGSNRLAMNIKLKKDKKKFAFGDIDAGSGPEDFYKLHAALFYYQPNTNLSYIGDLNNFGSSTLDYSDIIRLEGGVSDYLSTKKLSNLYNFSFDNVNVLRNKTQFSAFNFSHQLSEKIDVSGYVLFSKVYNERKNVTNIQYFENEIISSEDRQNNGNFKSKFGSGNFKFNYTPNKEERWKYNVNFQFSGNSNQNVLNTTTNTNSSIFETLNTNDDTSFKQYLEWHKSYNSRNTTTFVVNHTSDKNTLDNNWFTDKAFLAGLIPLQLDSNYNINQIGSLKANAIDALFKYYWIVNNFNHLYVILGNNNESDDFKKNEKQLLTSGVINDFSTADFGNDLRYNFNDAYLAIEYKFIIGKWINKPSLYLHHYNRKINNFFETSFLEKSFLTPKFESEYKFSNAHVITANYELANEFPQYNRLANRYNLQTYNAIYKGNEKLENEQYHSASIIYKKNDVYHGLLMDAMINYNSKTKTIRDEIVLNGINQFTSPILTNNPENTMSVRGNITKNVFQFSLGLNTNLLWYDYKQTLNNVLSNVKQNSQDIGIEIKTKNTKWPFVTIRYNKSFNTFNSVTISKFNSDKFSIEVNHDITNNLIFEADYQYQINKSSVIESTDFQIANAGLEYKQKNNPWIFKLSATNFLNNGIKNSNSFSDYTIANKTTYILPRIFLLSISYKL